MCNKFKIVSAWYLLCISTKKINETHFSVWGIVSHVKAKSGALRVTKLSKAPPKCARSMGDFLGRCQISEFDALHDF